MKYYDCDDEFTKVAQTSVDRLPIEHIRFENKLFFIATNKALKYYWKTVNNPQLQLVNV